MSEAVAPAAAAAAQQIAECVSVNASVGRGRGAQETFLVRSPRKVARP